MKRDTALLEYLKQTMAGIALICSTNSSMLSFRKDKLTFMKNTKEVTELKKTVNCVFGVPVLITKVT